ncbi:MAG TPA: T9SS type A sorting domain-containing protein [Paludibacteraceae bacterium]|nr:T9SS type A sorting domain-containing protein [Paludibacteraceae bacterium]
MKMKNFFSLLWTILIIHISMGTQAQNPTYLCELRNDTQVSSTVFEFDIYLLQTGSIPFEYAAGQYGILINPLIKNGGVISASIVAGSSDPALIAASQNPTSINFLAASNCIRIAGRVPPGAGNGAVISNGSPGTKVCRVRLTNTVAFGQFSPNLTWTTTNIYPTQINAYVGGVNTAIMVPASQTTNNLNNLVLNQNLPIVYAVTGSGSYCFGAGGLAVGLANSEIGVTYTLYKDNIAQIPTLDGIGAALDFGLQVAGTYTVVGTNGSGSSAMSGSAVITEIPIPVAPTVNVIDNCGSSTLTASAFTGTLLWNTAETTASINVSSTGSYTVTQTISGCTSPAGSGLAAPLTIPATPVVGTITQPTCTAATGSVILSGLPAGNWTINPGNITGTGTSTTISSLATGTYNFSVNDGTCTSIASANVVINTQPGTPAAPTLGTITQPSCTLATGSVILTGLPAGNWTIDPGAITGSTTSTTISGLIAGTYSYTVTNSAGCISVASANVVINAQPLIPTAPVVETITQPTCVLATGSVLLSGLPAGNWTLNPGNIAGSGTTTTISGLAAGTYTYTVNNGTCISSASANVVINAQPLTPGAPTIGTFTQPTCLLATGSVVLNNLPAGNWTINPGNITGTGTSTTVSGLAPGTYNFTVTNSAGCTSAVSANVVINAQPITPAAPTVATITQPNCDLATGSVLLSGLPSGNWVINPGTITGNTASTTITGLAPGTYNFMVTNSSGCTSVTSTNVVINVQPVIPSAPVVGTITQPTCTLSTGSVLLNGLPAGNWTINPGNISGTGTSTTISGLAAGTYNFTVNDGTCTSVASANVVINTQPETPVIADQSTSISSGATFTVIPAGVPAGTTYTWTPPTYTGGVTGGSAQAIPQTDISGMLTIPSGSGTAIYTVTPTSGLCVGASFTVTVTVIGINHTISGKTRYAAKANAGNPAPNMPSYNAAIYNIDNVEVKLKSGNTVLATTMSDANGYFQFTNVTDGNYILAYDHIPYDTMQYVNHVNAVDLALIKYLIGHDTVSDPSRSFTIKHKRAANVDNNASINTVDIARISAKIGLPNDRTRNFPKGNWVALDTSVTVAGADLNITLQTIAYADYDASSSRYKDSLTNWGMAKVLPDENIIIRSDESIIMSDPEYFEVPLRISTKMNELSALGLELSYPSEHYKLVSTSMSNTGKKGGAIKINPALEEIIAANNDLLVTDVDGVIRVVYATTDYFDIAANDELIRLGFLSLNDPGLGELDFKLNGTGLIANQYGEINADAYLTMPKIFVQSNDMEAGFEFAGYPNPFSNDATLTYSIPENGTVRLKVYNTIGEMIAEPVNESQLSGKHSVVFSPKNLPAGMYTFKLEYTGLNKSKCVILKLIH